jgi:hypothetical protein
LLFWEELIVTTSDHPGLALRDHGVLRISNRSPRNPTVLVFLLAFVLFGGALDLLPDIGKLFDGQFAQAPELGNGDANQPGRDLDGSELPLLPQPPNSRPRKRGMPGKGGRAEKLRFMNGTRRFAVGLVSRLCHHRRALGFRRQGLTPFKSVQRCFAFRQQ